MTAPKDEVRVVEEEVEEVGEESKRAGVGLLDGSISPQWAAFDVVGITELQTVQGKTLNSPVMIGKRRTCDQIMQNHS